MSPRAACLAVVIVAALTTTASAQGGGKPATGNPTPGTAQPDAPNLADRVTIVGCLQPLGAAAVDANTPTDSRYELIKAERVDRVPPGTGGSPAAARVSGKTYRLEGIESVFSPFVGARVEISGEVKTSASAKVPIVTVAFVQKLAATCS